MDRNEITLTGRVSRPPVQKPLASGNTLTTWLVVVRRPRRPGETAPVDTIECITFEDELAASVCQWRPGDVVEVAGSLRRRFFTAAGGKTSTYAVEATTAHLIERGPPPRPTKWRPTEPTSIDRPRHRERLPHTPPTPAPEEPVPPPRGPA
ncbi:single-strand DNA-binding protein [Thermocatellispora tengchongensis]|uniref:Single-strand DNA-binding protein n=1 Tax=Thermocatellispora tengchongensis TaxID=1073253 RepID=A0A840P9Q2_9ACTN|nr:single-stranded DNA-binding protein [Thermocatellispora tengchongensis]MBB5136012.1 single-strand DNA-binding protein [Thermocatellispora tengchongensis]